MSNLKRGAGEASIKAIANVPPMHKARAIRMAIEAERIRTSTESAAQADVFSALTSAGIDCVREFRIDAKSRVDVLAYGDIAVEVKVQGSKRNIWRQIERYAQHERIVAVVLATSVVLPINATAIAGKPVVVASLSRGWL